MWLTPPPLAHYGYATVQRLRRWSNILCDRWAMRPYNQKQDFLHFVKDWNPSFVLWWPRPSSVKVKYKGFSHIIFIYFNIHVKIIKYTNIGIELSVVYHFLNLGWNVNLIIGHFRQCIRHVRGINVQPVILSLVWIFHLPLGQSHASAYRMTRGYDQGINSWDPLVR